MKPVIHLFLSFTMVLSLCSELKIDSLWKNWKRNHGRQYTIEEDARRRAIWKRELDHVNRHNQRFEEGLETYLKGMNEYSDLEWEEFRRMYLLQTEYSDELHSNDKPARNYQAMAKRIPDHWDWRSAGVVTPIKNQVSEFTEILIDLKISG